MSLLRRRMMMQTALGDPIPRERIVFSNAGDEIVAGKTKSYGGEAIFGLAILYQTSYSSNKPYWMYLVGITKSGLDFNAVKVGGLTECPYYRFADQSRVNHALSTTKTGVPQFDTEAEGIAYLKTININRLPILNELTGHSYTGSWLAGGQFANTQAGKDLFDYYNGVI